MYKPALYSSQHQPKTILRTDCVSFTSRGMQPHSDRNQLHLFIPIGSRKKTMDARFNSVGLFMNISACMATDIWTETEVMKEMENRFRTMTHLQSVMVRRHFRDGS